MNDSRGLAPPGNLPSVVSDPPNEANGASFRDPSGYVFVRDGVVYRQVNQSWKSEYTRLMTSGLYEAVTASGDLIAHAEAQDACTSGPGGWQVLRPEQIGFISYPYEWCFGQLKDAALLTLRLQRMAMQFGMSLKDATAFNVQFHKGRPVWIDTLSFETLREGEPWVAYRQFCEFFLAPLALMAHADYRLSHLLRAFIDGVPIDLAASLLPWRTRLAAGLGVHVHLHAAAHRKLLSRRPAGPASRPSPRRGRTALLALIDSLERTVQRLTWKPTGTVWGDYYSDTNYSGESFAHKRTVVEQAIERIRPRTVWDLGANIGTFSRLASDRGIPTVAFDVDAAAVQQNYDRAVENREPNLLPLVLDLTNPSAATGWANKERMSVAERGPADLTLALALIHHLAIGHNVPFDRIADFLRSVSRALVIEFVPKDDSQVQRLLASRQDVFEDYTQDAFEAAFSIRFEIDRVVPLRESRRALYVMTRRDP